MSAQTCTRWTLISLASVLALALLATPSSVRAQDDAIPDAPSQPEKKKAQKNGLNHKQLVENITKQPLAEEPMLGADGKPISDEQRKDVEKSGALLAEATKARAQGKYTDAVAKVDEAVALLRKTVGVRNHRAVAALVEQMELAKIVKLSPDAQARVAQADKALVGAIQAHEDGDYPKACDLAADAARTYEVLIGKDAASLVPVLIAQARAETEIKHLDIAETALTRALTIAEAAYGKNHPQVARVLDRQGWLLINQGKYREAIAAMTRAVRIFRANVGETAELAETLDNLGTALAAIPDYGRALASKLRAYVIREKVLGPEAKDTGVSLSNLAWLYARGPEEQRGEVIPLRKRALAIFKRVLGPDHPYTLLEMANLAASYRSEDMDDDALGLYKELIARDDAQAGPVDVRMIERRIVLANFLLRRGDWAEGLQHLDAAAGIAKKLYEQGDKKNGSEQVQILSTAYYNQRQYDKAIEMIRQVQAWAKDAKEEKNDYTIGRQRRLGAILLEIGKVEEGTKILQAAADDAKELYGEGDLRTGTPLLKLAEAYELTGDMEKAEDACNQALRIAEEKLPPGSRSYGYCLRVMGRIYAATDQYDLANFSFDEAKELFEESRMAKMDPLALIGTLQDYAACKLRQGKTDEAIQFCRDALKVCEDTLIEPLTINMIAEVAKAKYHLWKSLENKAGAAKEREQLGSDLKSLLGKLKDGNGMSAETKKWLAEVS